jgi:alkylation response protein AidB-like acyl-CoA dehydrogenase
MDLTGTKPWWPLGDTEQMGDAVRHWLSKHWDAGITVGEWWDHLAAAGLTVPTWQRAHGGIGATTQIQTAIERELAAAHTVAPPVSGVGVRVVGPAVRQFASHEQMPGLIGPMIRGRASWCVLLHEPDGRDPLTATCRLTRDWSSITVSGHKSITDNTAHPTHALLVTRSTEEGGRKGITCVVTSLDQPGISIQDSTVTFDSVKLPHEAVLGEQDQGWAVVKVITPYFERSLAGRIRRGMVHVEPGTAAGNLERKVGDVISSTPFPPPAPVDRRQR